jgi:hypothetical protein
VGPEVRAVNRWVRLAVWLSLPFAFFTLGGMARDVFAALGWMP